MLVVVGLRVGGLGRAVVRCGRLMLLLRGGVEEEEVEEGDGKGAYCFGSV